MQEGKIGLPPERLRAYFDDLVPGVNWGEHRWVADQTFCNEWARLMGFGNNLSSHDQHLSHSSEPQTVVPLDMAFVFLTDCIIALMPIRPPGGVLATQKLKLLAPMRVGDVFRTRLKVLEKFVKNEHRFVRLGTETLNEEGELVLLGERLSIWGG